MIFLVVLSPELTGKDLPLPLLMSVSSLLAVSRVLRQARSYNRNLFPQGGVAGQETKVSVSNASHWMELVQEYLVDGTGQAADKVAVPLPSGLPSTWSV